MMSAQNITQYAMRVGHVEADQEEEYNRPDPFPYSENEDIPLPENYQPTKRKPLEGCGR